MIYTVKWSSRFKREYKACKKRGLNMALLHTVVETLASGETLPEKNRDHALKGDHTGLRECHIQPDWLLVYYHNNDTLVLNLMQTGSHSDLFG